MTVIADPVRLPVVRARRRPTVTVRALRDDSLVELTVPGTAALLDPVHARYVAARLEAAAYRAQALGRVCLLKPRWGLSVESTGEGVQLAAGQWRRRLTVTAARRLAYELLCAVGRCATEADWTLIGIGASSRETRAAVAEVRATAAWAEAARTGELSVPLATAVDLVAESESDSGWQPSRSIAEARARRRAS